MIELPYPPSVNRMWRNFNGRMVLSAEGRQYKHMAGMIAKMSGIKMLHGDVELSVVLHPRMNKDGSASEVRIDLDNALKATDCLNGIAYKDDKQIVRIIAEVGKPVKDGGMTVSIRGVEWRTMTLPGTLSSQE